jgi:hypothetical protein
MKSPKKFTVILSAYDHENLSHTFNLVITESLRHKLATHNYTGIPYQPAVGCFKGNAEQCFIVHTNSSHIVNILKSMAWEYNQECILVANNQKNKIHLHYPDSAPLLIGERFAVNNKLIGNKLLSYTIVDNDYWEVI